MTGLWQADWFDTAASGRRELWRGVEAQHQVATMRLVDDLAEQHLLEQLLDASKPPPPAGCEGLHYLLATPFRYSPPFASRFRLPEHPGAWYGADHPHTVAAEVAWWRWHHFFMQSDGLRGGELVTEHTFFQARFNGLELDLTAAPWSTRRERWRDPVDYGACHALASHLREHRPDIQAIRYESARREHGWCNAVLHPGTLSLARSPRQQTWVCKTTATRVMLVHQSPPRTEALQFEMSPGTPPSAPAPVNSSAPRSARSRASRPPR